MEFLPLSPRGFSLTSTVSICSFSLSLSITAVAHSLSFLLLHSHPLTTSNPLAINGTILYPLPLSFSLSNLFSPIAPHHLTWLSTALFLSLFHFHSLLVPFHLMHLFFSLSRAVPPMIWVPNQSIPAVPGGEAVLVCNTEAYPISINYWTRDEEESLMPSVKYEIVNSEKSYKVQMTLRIRELSPSDFTTYKCFARNSLGSTQGSIKLYGTLLTHSIALSLSLSRVCFICLCTFHYFFICIVYFTAVSCLVRFTLCFTVPLIALLQWPSHWTLCVCVIHCVCECVWLSHSHSHCVSIALSPLCRPLFLLHFNCQWSRVYCNLREKQARWTFDWTFYLMWERRKHPLLQFSCPEEFADLSQRSVCFLPSQFNFLSFSLLMCNFHHSTRQPFTECVCLHSREGFSRTALNYSPMYKVQFTFATSLHSTIKYKSTSHAHKKLLSLSLSRSRSRFCYYCLFLHFHVNCSIVNCTLCLSLYPLSHILSHFNLPVTVRELSLSLCRHTLASTVCSACSVDFSFGTGTSLTFQFRRLTFTAPSWFFLSSLSLFCNLFLFASSSSSSHTW